MKSRTDKILLAVFLLSLLAYAAMIYTYLTYDVGQSAPSHLELWFARRFLFWMSLSFHAVPAFCLQLFLCRRKRRWMAAALAIIMIGAALRFTCGFFTATGHSTVGWSILMFLSIAPAAGCFLAWAVTLLYRHHLRKEGVQ